MVLEQYGELVDGGGKEGMDVNEKTLANPTGCATLTLKEVRCSCGKLLGKVQEGAAHEHKCPRCKSLIESKPWRCGHIGKARYEKTGFYCVTCNSLVL